MFDHLGDGAGFRRLMGSLGEAERQEIGKLLGMAGPRDMISVNYALDERVKAVANDYLRQAKALRAGRSAAASPKAALERARGVGGKSHATAGGPGAITFPPGCN